MEEGEGALVRALERFDCRVRVARNGQADEMVYVAEGAGTLESAFGDIAYRQGDYVVVPLAAGWSDVGS
mgnify:CR=1 FL=1